MGNDCWERKSYQQSTFKPLIAPYEDESKTYIKSFDIHTEKKEIREFFLKYGFVAIKNVIT